MNKIILLLVAFATQINFAQNVFPTTGNVGIGTTTPSEKLEIYNSDTTPGVLSLKSLRNDFQYVDVGRISAKQGSVEVSRIGMPRSGETNTGYFTFWTKAGNAEILTEKVRISENGNLGIGTTSPNSRLTIKSGTSGVSIHPGSGANSYFGSIAFNRESATGEIFDNRAYAFQINNGNNVYDKSLHFQIYDTSGIQIANNALVISGATGGNIGIGTASPLALLDIYSPLPLVGSYDTQKWSTSNVDYNLKLQTIWNNSGINQEFIQRYNGIDYKSLVFFAGNVGIGTSTPNTKLAVNGTIRSKEVKVEIANWPDHVFKKEYSLPTLEEVEKHITKNGHLEDIPSEQEVLKNGINLGEMDAKLLQKIEELTLYMIEMKKDITALKQENKELKTQICN